jgi:hypothetical protein
MTSKCGRCRRKLVHKKRRYVAADGSKFIACTCGLQWVVQQFATGWRSPRVTRLKAPKETT